MRPLFLLTNDDGYQARGLLHLIKVAGEMADIVVMAPEHNASGVSTSITCTRPLHVRIVQETPAVKIYACDGTPADCVKMGLEHFCPRRPSLVLSGINHGSNSSINIVYSATMGAVLEGCLDGYPSVGFSLLNHNPEADFSGCTAGIRRILQRLLEHPLPEWTALNINIPRLPADQIRGIRVCRQARAVWTDSLTPITDTDGASCWKMTGKFVCPDPAPDTDERALAEGYISVVPIRPDLTYVPVIPQLTELLATNSEL